MPFLEWKPDMSVGVVALDNDHKKLVALVNELHDGIHAGHSKEALGHVLGELIKYTQSHFRHEEMLFDRTGYPNAEAHKKEHADLVQKAVDLQSRFATSGPSMLSLETMRFLKEWLAHHIHETDKKYSAHLNAKGVH